MKHLLILENWLKWLSINARGWRILVGFTCVICLATFLHFREIRLKVLELNTIASRFVIAQVDFEFPDYEATVLLKQQAMQDVGKIYEIEEKQIHKTRTHLEDLLIHSRKWRQAAPKSTFDEMYKAADEIESILLEARFTDPRTIQKIKDLSFPENKYQEVLYEGEKAPVQLPEDFWKDVEQQIAKDGFFHTETIRYVVSEFQKVHWTLVQDILLEDALRSQVGGKVPQKVTKVHAGQRIINQGERVTSHHLVMMQAMKQALSDGRHLSAPLTWVASFLIALIFVTISALYFRISQVAFVRSLRRISLFVGIVIVMLLLSKLTEYILLKGTSPIFAEIRYPILAPFATLLICILLSPRTALFGATFLSIILSVSLAVDHGRFLVLNLVTSIAIIICSQKIRRRKEVFTVCLKGALSAIPVLYTFTLGENYFWTGSFVIDVASAFVFFFVIAILVVGILPVLETLFGILTDMSLVEYMDPNSDLLRDFAAAVPGTYQHSLILGNLAESCARAIGANGLFCKSATLYHDIGKLKNPQFFTENQQDLLNMHQLLTPLESARVIISHVTDGVQLARKYRLPESFIEIIREHHGTTLVYYFYHQELEKQGLDKKKINEAAFRYPGPKPRSKEAAIIMICDSVEAASRSIDEPSEETLTDVVTRIVQKKAEDGQFDESQLTFEDLGKIKKALVQALLLAHHVRIKYPERD